MTKAVFFYVFCHIYTHFLFISQKFEHYLCDLLYKMTDVLYYFLCIYFLQRMIAFGPISSDPIQTQDKPDINEMKVTESKVCTLTVFLLNKYLLQL